MHKMLHDAQPSALQGINDGPDPNAQNQYSYDQVTALAVNGAVNDGLVKNSQSLVYFALAVPNQTATPAQPCVQYPLQPSADT